MQRRKLFTGMLAVLSAVIMISVPVLASEIPEGVYKAQDGTDLYEFRDDGSLVYNGIEGIYRISEDELTVFAGGHAYKYTYEIFNDMLILYGSDGIGDIFDAIELSGAVGIIQIANIGDTVTFGTYEQDNDLTNGSEAIEWEVLDLQDGKALLLSKYALDCQPYNEEFAEVTWETCTLRAWLNEDFLNTAFSPEEIDVIAETTVINADNEAYETEGGNDTLDKIFLLSLNDIEEYYGVGPDEWYSGENYSLQESLVCRLTDYGRERCIHNYAKLSGETIEVAEKWYTDNEEEYGQNWCWWWLRSPGFDSYIAACVSSGGSVDDDCGNYVYNASEAVRPALWVNLKS